MKIGKVSHNSITCGRTFDRPLSAKIGQLYPRAETSTACIIARLLLGELGIDNQKRKGVFKNFDHFMSEYKAKGYKKCARKIQNGLHKRTSAGRETDCKH